MPLRLLFRWRVLAAVGDLLTKAGTALSDNDLSAADRAILMKSFWNLIRVARGVK